MPKVFQQDPTLPEGFSTTFRSRFWAKVNKKSAEVRPGLGGCWNWTGGKGHGYGAISTGGRFRTIRASNASLLLHTGKLSTKCVLHKCDNPACVRPDHLFEGTRQDNTRDMMAKRRSHWQNGVFAAMRKAYDETKIQWYKSLGEKPLCQVLGCTRPAERTPHHVNGRLGQLKCDTRFWLAVCKTCHRRIHLNPEWARSLNLLAKPGQWNNTKLCTQTEITNQQQKE